MLLLFQPSSTNTDLVFYYPGPPARVEPITNTPFFDVNGSYSPDGRAILYMSLESGVPELYVRNLAGNGEKIQLTTGEDVESPLWSHNGREVFYFSNRRGTVNSIEMTTNPDLKIGAKSTLFEFPLEVSGRGPAQRFVVSPDGQRFLMNRRSESASAQPFVLVQNWTSLLQKK